MVYVHDCTTWKVSYCSNYFAIDFYGTRLHVLLSYIENCAFSFCRLHRRLVAFIDPDHTRTHQSFKSQLPSWLLCELNVLSLRLSILSVSQLCAVTRQLHLSHSRDKSGVMHAIVEDFFRERVQFFQKQPVAHTTPLMISICDYFNSRYGSTVTNALQDVRSSKFFGDEHIHIEHSVLYGSTWLTRSFDDMISRLTRISKEEILDCLHLIPARFRPSYNTCSIRSCRSALLHHIRGCILHLASLTDPQFVEAFCVRY